jgi:hypothetical protein
MPILSAAASTDLLHRLTFQVGELEKIVNHLDDESVHARLKIEVLEAHAAEVDGFCIVDTLQRLTANTNMLEADVETFDSAFPRLHTQFRELRAAHFETSCLAQRLKVHCDAMHESFAEVKLAFSRLDLDVGLINLRPNEPLVSSGDMRSLLRTGPPPPEEDGPLPHAQDDTNSSIGLFYMSAYESDHSDSASNARYSGAPEQTSAPSASSHMAPPPPSNASSHMAPPQQSDAALRL